MKRFSTFLFCGSLLCTARFLLTLLTHKSFASKCFVRLTAVTTTVQSGVAASLAVSLAVSCRVSAFWLGRFFHVCTFQGCCGLGLERISGFFHVTSFLACHFDLGKKAAYVVAKHLVNHGPIQTPSHFKVAAACPEVVFLEKNALSVTFPDVWLDNVRCGKCYARYIAWVCQII